MTWVGLPRQPELVCHPLRVSARRIASSLSASVTIFGLNRSCIWDVRSPDCRNLPIIKRCAIFYSRVRLRWEWTVGNIGSGSYNPCSAIGDFVDLSADCLSSCNILRRVLLRVLLLHDSITQWQEFPPICIQMEQNPSLECTQSNFADHNLCFPIAIPK
jgi:hypothetical protein